MFIPKRAIIRASLLGLGLNVLLTTYLSAFTPCNRVVVYTNKFGELYLEIVAYTIVVLVNFYYLWRDLKDDIKEELSN